MYLYKRFFKTICFIVTGKCCGILFGDIAMQIQGDLSLQRQQDVTAEKRGVRHGITNGDGLTKTSE